MLHAQSKRAASPLEKDLSSIKDAGTAVSPTPPLLEPPKTQGMIARAEMQSYFLSNVTLSSTISLPLILT